MVNKRNRTSSEYIDYGLYLYFLGLSLRNVVKALSFLHIVKRSHVAIWNWIQKFRPQSISSTRRNKVSEYIVDETLVKVGSKLVWLWIAIEPENGQILALFLQKYLKKETCLLPSTFCQVLSETTVYILFQPMVGGTGIHKPVSS